MQEILTKDKKKKTIIIAITGRKKILSNYREKEKKQRRVRTINN